MQNLRDVLILIFKKFNLNKFVDFISYISINKDLTNIVEKYVNFIEYFDNLDENKISADIKNIYLELFNTFWNLIAIYNFKNSIKEYYSFQNLDQEQLNSKFNLEININKEEFNEFLDLFFDEFYLEDNLNSDRSDNIKKILSRE